MSARDELERLYGNKGEKKPGKGIASTVAGVASRAVSTAENMVARTTGNSSRKTAGQLLKDQYGSADAPGTVRKRSAREGLEKYNRDNDPLTNIARRVVGAPDRAPNDQWQEDWLEEFYVRYNTDQDSAYSYAKEVNNGLAAQRLAADQERIKKTAVRNPVASTIAGVVASPFALLDAADKGLTYLATGELHQRDRVTLGDVSRVMTAGVAESLNEKHGTLGEGIPVIGGKGWGDAYSLGNSALQSLVLGNTIGSAATLATFFGQGASSGMEEIKARGGSDGQAILYGLISGGAEVLTEKLPLDNLLKGGDAMRFTLKGWLGNAAKQGLLEGGEELASSIANEMADRWIMGDKSNFAVRVQEYMTQGMDEEEAKKKAWLDYANDAAFDFIGGAASGAGSMTVQTALPTALANYQTSRASTPESNAALIERALTADEGTKPHKLAQKYQGTEKLTGGQINDLDAAYQEYEAQMRYTLATEKAGEKLEELNAEDSTVATAIAKTLTGKDLNRRERRALDRSAEGKKVLQDMQADRSWQRDDTATAESRNTGDTAEDPLLTAMEEAEAAEETGESADGAVAENATAEPSGISEQLEQSVNESVDTPVENVEEVAPISDDSGAEVEPQAKSRTIEEVAGEYGNQAKAVSELYQEGQDVEGFASAVRAAWEMGGSGIPMERVNSSPRTQGITAEQRRTAYLLGQGAARVAARSRTAANTKKATGGTLRRKGVVKAQSGITIDELSKTFNDRQRSAYKLLSFYAEVTGIDVVLYKGTQEQESGRFAHGEDTIYIDITAGTNGWDTTDLSAYTMMRTFAHEFVHFVEKWSAEQYNHLREVVFDQMEKNGQDAEAMVELAMQEQGLDFDQASREVVAESLTDILPDSQFAQILASKHKTLFEKVKERLEAFVAELKDHWKKLTGNNSREAVALKTQVGEALGYAEETLQVFDRAAGEAVEAYQATVSEKETVKEQPKPKKVEKPKAETEQAAEPEKPTEAPKQEAQTITDDRFSIEATEGGTVYVTFPGKPDAAVRDALKEQGFKWSPKKKAWYAKGDPAAVADVLREVYKAEETLKAEEPVEAAPKTEEATSVAEAVQEMEGATPSEKIANAIVRDYLSKDRVIDAQKLYALADKAFGGTQGQGAYDRKDAYDALELAVNKYLLDFAKDMNGNGMKAMQSVRKLEELLRFLPTQTVRTQEQQDFQQFSTPPNIAYLAAWAGNVQPGEMVLEPSAGIGGIAVFAKSWGAEVAVNELSKRRLGILERMGFDHMFNENAEQIDNVLPENIQPSLVLMNPPFSSTAGRTAHNKTSNAERHIDQALARLSDGGRLVAVLGKGMNDADYRKYWNKVRKEYTIRANLSIDGSNYRKYGTTWGVQLVVIDKVGPQTGQTVTGSFTDLTEVPGILEEIRNDRKAVERAGTDGGEHRDRMGVPDQRDGASEAGSEGSRVGDPGKPARAAGQRNRKSDEGSRAVRDQSDDGGLRKSGADSGQSEVGRDVRENLRTDHRADHESAGAGELARPQPQRTSRLTEEAPREDDGVYATFVIPDVPIPGGKKHPATLVESAAMSAVPMPKATYTPTLPANVVANNLSDAQMVTVTYAGQAHAQLLPDGSRRGFFIGDGTGVGKGRQIAGIILDNFMQGCTKAVWVSENGGLYGDAVRDWTGTTGRSKDEVLNHSKTKLNGPIKGDSGILFTTYPMLRSGKNNVTRLDQIVSWLGEDFDGVIAFDEAHNMGNLYGKKGSRGKTAGSEQAKAGVELQRRLPKARIVYVSATAATEVDNLAYAERLGLWGKGTAFANAQDFISKIGSSGLAAMELVVRDMKAMGAYTARSISYQGVAYDTIEHTLDENQTIIYNTMSSAWQTVMQNVHKALELTGGNKNSRARANAMGQFYSSMQRFYNQALTSMSMPSVIADIRRELAAGHSCVLQIVNTNEAQQEKALAQAKAEKMELDDLDLTPREALIGYLETCFPVQEFEEYTDEEGNLKSRPVTNSKGEPVISKTAVAMREALIEEIKSMSIPDGPMEMLFDAFGVEMVAENTGRSRRVVPKRQSDGTIKRVEERRSLNSRTADVQAFQDGKKRILVFSDAGGTGKSYHADRSEKNQQQRIHYVLQPGWSASNAVQGFGRTHRSNEASAPIYKLVTTNIKGQKRFTSTIARRLDQLGALTKGQRDTGSGMFGAKDNLETPLARDALREFYNRLGNGQIEGVDGEMTLVRLGLRDKFYDEFGRFKINENTAREMSTFLNRILALEVDEQNTVFDCFTGIYEMMLEEAIQKGTLDTGMENVKADKIEILDDKIIREDGNGGAATHYIQAKTYRKPEIITTVAAAEKARQGFVGIYETDNGSVRAVYRMADKTTEWGRVVKQYRLVSPNKGASTTVWQEDTLQKRAKLLEQKDWQKAWDKEVQQVPEYNEDTMHMLTGALLPIWNSLPQEGSTKVKRLIASDGSTYLGRVVDPHQIDLVLRQFQTSRTMEQFTPRQVMDKALTGTTFDLSRERGKIFRSRVSGEWRIEIKQTNDWQLKRYPGLMTERINFQTRHFIPNSPQGEKLLEEILKNNPVRDVGREDQLQVRRVALTDRQVLELARGRIDESKLTPAERDGFRIFSERLDRLRTLQEDRAELGQLYREQQFGPGGDRKAAAETLEKMHRLDEAIEAAANKVLEAEQGAALRKVLQEARKVVQKDQADHDEAVLKEYRQKTQESAAQRKYRRAIQREVATLREWLVHPDNKNALKHIPDVLKGPVGSLIAAIDLTSTGGGTQADERMAKKMQAVLDAYKRHIEDVGGLYSGYTDLPPDFVDRLTEMVNKTWQIARSGSGTYKIKGGEMSAADLRALYQLIREMKRHITTVNKFHANAMFQFAPDAAQDTMNHLGKQGKHQNSAMDGTDQFLFWKNVRPAYIFERFGKGGMAIYDGLRRGQGQLARNTEVIKKFADRAYTAQEVNAWEKEIRTIRLPSEDKKIRLTVAQIMSLYCLSKREQAVPHLLGGGIRGANIEGTDTEARHLTPEDLEAIIGRLSKRQRAVADKLQKFMSEQGGEWGNAVTVKRFGERQFTEEHYFPISTDGQLRNAEADKPDGSDLYALLNMSFTKKLTPNANNRVMLYSVFDVFANHMAGMAQYNAMALPVLDALKWFNYRETWKTVDGKPSQDSVREQMVRAFGAPVSKGGVKDGKGYAETFVLNILRSYNGTEAQGTPNDGMGMQMLHRYNRAQVAWNASVVLKQPLAILRAAQEIPYTAIMKGMATSPAQRKQDIAEMLKYSGIAAWKNLGFYDVNISRGLGKLIKHNDTILEKYVEKGMAAAEWADRQTWGAIWHACKVQTGGNMEKTAKLFEDVIYKTQVVDSILTKTEYMRDKGFFSRLTSSFMSEPVTAVSPFLETAFRIKEEASRKGGSFQAAWQKHGGKLGRYAMVYGVTAVMTGILQSLIDAWRDDDDYKTFSEKFLEGLGGNIVQEVNPFEKLPVVKEIGTIFSAVVAKARGEDEWLQLSTLPMADVAEYTVDATEILMKKLKGQNTDYTWYGSVRKYLQAASGGFGIPAATFSREVVDVWNNIVVPMAPSLGIDAEKIKTYKAKDLTQIRDAFLEGYLTGEEAADRLSELVDSANGDKDKLEKMGLASIEDEDDIHAAILKWQCEVDTGIAFSDIKDAYLEGVVSETEAVRMYSEYGGYSQKQAEKTVLKWRAEKDTGTEFSETEDAFVSGKLTADEAQDILQAYGGYARVEAESKVLQWQCEVDTGIKYSEVQQLYVDGELTADEAKELRVEYGESSLEDARKTVLHWQCEKDNGVKYSDIDVSYLSGDITERNAIDWLMKYGEKDEDEAKMAVQAYRWRDKHTEYKDLDDSAIDRYIDYCEGAGVSIPDFYAAKREVSAIKETGGSVKDNVVRYIRSLPLSRSQKWALWYAVKTKSWKDNVSF